MRTSRSSLLGALALALAAAAPQQQHQILVVDGSAHGGRKSAARKLRNWWKPTRTVSSKRRDPSDPRQAVLIAAAHAKRERRAVKLTRDYARCIGGAYA